MLDIAVRSSPQFGNDADPAADGSSVLALVALIRRGRVAIGCVEATEHAAVAALAPAELRGSAFRLLVDGRPSRRSRANALPLLPGADYEL